jgi:phosphoesterase RecJ-like protein
MSTRQGRVESVIKREISRIIQDELRDPRIGFVTVTDVEVTRDLRHARVFVSFMGDEQAGREGLEGLRQAQGFMRTELGRRAYLRVVPEITFRLDRSAARGERIERVIEEAKREKPGALITALEDASRLVQSAQSCFLVSHVKPDGDSVGSILALGRLLRASGKRIVMACPDPVPRIYGFLAGADEVQSSPDDEIFDLAIVIDCENADRVGALRGVVDRARSVLNIDHHPENQRFGDVAVSDAKAGATGEVVYELCEQLGVAPDAEAAEALYTAISTDTGRFHFANVRPRTLEIAGDLVRLGADPVRVAYECYEKKPMGAVRLHGLALSRCRSDRDGAIVWSEIGPQDFADTASAEEDTEGIMTVLRAIDGVVLAALFTEAPPGGSTRVSLRANGDHDVSAVARKFGGGGHLVAAGCVVAGPLAEAREAVVEELRALLDGERG